MPNGNHAPTSYQIFLCELKTLTRQFFTKVQTFPPSLFRYSFYFIFGKGKRDSLV